MSSISLEQIEKVFAKWSNPSEMRLRAGEMTAQEVRTAQAILSAVKAQLIDSSDTPSLSNVYRKRKTSNLSSDRLMIEADIGDYYEVRPWNFTKNEWMRSTRVMRKTTFHANYEPESTD